MMIDRYDNKGVASASIILFGLLALSVVLLNGISISVKKQQAGQSGKEAAVSYCYRSHQKFPAECTVTSVYSCDDNYLLSSNCLGVGDVILNYQGEYINWCGYTAFDSIESNCGQYWLDKAGKNCKEFNNLCL